MKPNLTKSNTFSNVLFSIIPKIHLGAFAFFMLIVLITGRLGILSIIGFNVLLFSLSIKFAILIHEIGHLFFAKIVGGTPRRLELGQGHKVAKTTLLSVVLVLNSNFNSGFAYAAFDKKKHLRLKLFIYSFGGILFNLITAAIFLTMFEFSLDATEKIQFTMILGITNLLSGIIAIIPYNVVYHGMKLPSDGLTLFKIPFYKKTKLKELNSVNKVLDAMDCYEDKRYEEALVLFESFSEQTEGSKLANSNISLAHIKLGNFQKAYDLMIELVPQLEEETNKSYSGLLYNNLAWICLLINKLDEADKYSKIAIKQHPKTIFVRGTRGSVLIEIGQVQLGKQILIADVDFKFPNSHTLNGAMYIALACHKMNQPKDRDKYIKFVKDNVHLLDVDEMHLYENVLKRLNSEHPGDK